MPTEAPRISVNFTDKDSGLYETVIKDADMNERSDSGQVIWVLKQYYATRKKEAEVFTPTELTEGERRKAPVFGTRQTPALEPLVEPRKRQGPGES